MENSILKSTKKILGIAADYTVFDLDVITHINTAFSTLTQLGVGPAEGFMIEDDTAVWTDFITDGDLQYNAVKSYVYLRVRQLFDPPSTSYLITAVNDQIKELEWRLNVHREETGWVDPNAPPLPPEDLPVEPATDARIETLEPSSAALSSADMQIYVRGTKYIDNLDPRPDLKVARITSDVNGAIFDGEFHPSDDINAMAIFYGIQSGAAVGPATFGVYSPDGTVLLTNKLTFMWTATRVVVGEVS